MPIIKKLLLVPLSALTVLVGTLFMTPPTALAAVTCPDGSTVATADECSIADEGSKSAACEGITGTAGDCSNDSFFSGLVLTVANVLSILVGGFAVIWLVIGAIRFTTSSGDPNAITGARNTIVYALIGIIVAASAQLLVRFVIGKL